MNGRTIECGIFAILLGLTSIRIFVDHVGFMKAVDSFAFLLALLIMFESVKIKIKSGRANDDNIDVLNIIILITLIGGGFALTLLNYFDRISEKMSDILTIMAFAIALSDDWLSSTIFKIIDE